MISGPNQVAPESGLTEYPASVWLAPGVGPTPWMRSRETATSEISAIRRATVLHVPPPSGLLRIPKTDDVTSRYPM